MDVVARACWCGWVRCGGTTGTSRSRGRTRRLRSAARPPGRSRSRSHPRGVAPARYPTRPTTAKARPTPWAKRGGAGSSRCAGAARRGRTNVLNRYAAGVRCTPNATATAKSAAWTAEQRDAHRARRSDQAQRQHEAGQHRVELRSARIDLDRTRAAAGPLLVGGHGSPGCPGGVRRRGGRGTGFAARGVPTSTISRPGSVSGGRSGAVRPVRTFDTATSACGSGPLRGAWSASSRSWVQE